MTLPNISTTKINILSNQYGSITEIAGILVGQVEMDAALPTTGVTCILTPNGARASFDCRGGAPATHETDLLKCGNLVEKVQGIVLTGGSSFGLISAFGAQQYLAEQNLGWPVGRNKEEVVPIVPAAAIFDLGRSGNFTHRPTFELGYKAAEAAQSGYVQEGSVGAGSGAEVGHYLDVNLSGGVGTSCVHLDNNILVGALVVVNSAGLPVNLDTGEILGANYINNEFLGHDTCPDIPELSESEVAAWRDYVRSSSRYSRTSPDTTFFSANTVIGVVATNARLTRPELKRLAGVSHDGLARSLWPVHTPFDGDTLFSLSADEIDLPSGDDQAIRSQILSVIYECGAIAVTRAIARAALVASPKGNLAGYRNFFPSIYDPQIT